MLRGQPESLSGDDHGRTGLDGVVLGIINAIPAEGRMALSGDAQATGDLAPEQGDPTLHPADVDPTEAQIDTRLLKPHSTLINFDAKAACYHC